jgi:hypothetical protein
LRRRPAASWGLCSQTHRRPYGMFRSKKLRCEFRMPEETGGTLSSGNGTRRTPPWGFYRLRCQRESPFHRLAGYARDRPARADARLRGRRNSEDDAGRLRGPRARTEHKRRLILLPARHYPRHLLRRRPSSHWHPIRAGHPARTASTPLAACFGPGCVCNGTPDSSYPTPHRLSPHSIE